jgi:hypothetical protein
MKNKDYRIESKISTRLIGRALCTINVTKESEL